MKGASFVAPRGVSITIDPWDKGLPLETSEEWFASPVSSGAAVFIAEKVSSSDLRGQNSVYTAYVKAQLVERYSAKVIPHVTCIGRTSDSVEKLLDAYRSAGVRAILALRGGANSRGSQASGFSRASEFVRFIRARYEDKLAIGVGVYPEGHPESASREIDWSLMREKLELSDFGVAQVLFNPDPYSSLLEYLGRHHLSIPIVASVLPPTTAWPVFAWSRTYRLNVPPEVWTACRNIDRAIDFASRLCTILLSRGAPAVNVLTQSDPYVTRELLSRVRL
jgi:methylenetetrahydrofolate reductase (NADPH)